MFYKRATLLFTLLCYTSLLVAQRSTSSAGTSIYSSSGQMSYTLGQLNHASSGAPNSLTAGVLQVYNFSPFVVVQESQVSIWPNPVISVLYLKIGLNPLESIPYQLFNSSGRMVFQHILTEENTQIPMQNYTAGTYILRLLFPNQIPLSFKLIKL
jgi:hypothetical protein